MDNASHLQHLVDSPGGTVGVQAGGDEQLAVVPHHGDAAVPGQRVIPPLKESDSRPEIIQALGAFLRGHQRVHVAEDAVLEKAGQVVDVGQVGWSIAHQSGEEFFRHLGTADIHPFDADMGMLCFVGGNHAFDVVGEGIAQGNGPEFEGNGSVSSRLFGATRAQEQEEAEKPREGHQHIPK